MSRTAAPSGRLGGNLEALGVPELVQTLAHLRKTARVQVRSRTRYGEMWFEDGEMVHAAGERLLGDEAVYEMVDWREGSFQVDYGLTTATRSITQDATLLVLEGMRRIDEKPLSFPVRSAPPPRQASQPATYVLIAVGFAGLIAAFIVASGPVPPPLPSQAAGALVLAEPPRPSSPSPPSTQRPAAPRRSTQPVRKLEAPSIVAAPESAMAEEPVPFSAVAPTFKPPVPEVEPSRLLVSGKSSAAGGSLTVLVDGAPVWVQEVLEKGMRLEAEIELPPGDHVVLARLTGKAGNVHEDAVAGAFVSGESRVLRIAANRTIGAPVKVKLASAARELPKP